MPGVELLAERLEEEGFEVASLEAVKDGSICVARMAALRDGRRVFAKTLAEPHVDTDLFEIEADGLAALGELGGARVPAVIRVSPLLLVLEELGPRGEGEQFWEQLGRMIAALHTSTVSDRFGWHRDGRHGPGRMRQDNSWETDGYVFYAQHRILRWLPEPRVEAEFDRDERRAVERLCAALPELIRRTRRR
jgi:fructosamine-3-kinase